MTARPTTKPRRRGVCPGLSAPMPTGDGLLVRLWPRGTIPLAPFTALAAAARLHGNGIIEITSRGSIQVRGLSEASAPQFADAIAALGIAAEDGIPILHDPLAGIDAEGILDSTSLTEDLRRCIGERQLARRLSPKVSVAIDDGGAIDLNGIAADIRLKAERISGDIVFHVSVGGDAIHAFGLGQIKQIHGVEAVLRLLDAIADRGRDARARDILTAEGAGAFHSTIEALLSSPRGECENERSTTFPIGTFALRDGRMAVGIGFAFGHTQADPLNRLLEAAQSCGAIGARAAPDRALLVIGFAQNEARLFAAHAERLGFIVAAGDPRRKVIACAGAPICGSAHIASRALAPGIAADSAQFDGTIHISGCTKGCAHAGSAALTLVGMPEGCAMIANGSTRDASFAVVPESGLRAAIANYARQCHGETAHV
jgi:precorrin-3B synthase